jgi:hypothetical protein
MYNFTKRDEQIFSDLKAGFKEFGLPIKTEDRIGGFMVIDSEFEYNAYPIKILIMLDPPHDTVTMTIHYGMAPSEKIAILYELIDRINMTLCTSHFAVHPDTGQIALLSGMYFADDRINKKEFHMILKQLLSDSYNFAPLIGKQLQSDETPAEMFKKFLEDNKDRIV